MQRDSTTGLMKTEFRRTAIVIISNKCYYVSAENPKEKAKVSCKGIQKANNKGMINLENYLTCTLENQKQRANNVGFRSVDRKMITYRQNKIGLSPVYTKRMVFDDGIHTCPLMI